MYFISQKEKLWNTCKIFITMRLNVCHWQILSLFFFLFSLFFFSPLIYESTESAPNPWDLVGLVNVHLWDIFYIAWIEPLINEWRITSTIVRTLSEEYNIMQLLVISWCCILALLTRSKQISLLNTILITLPDWMILDLICKDKWEVIKQN